MGLLNTVQPTITPEGMRYRIGIISDLDEKSAVEGKSNLWASAFKRGYLTYDSLKKKVKLEWDEGDEIQLQSGTNCIEIGLPGNLILSKRKGLLEVLFS